MGNLPPSTSQGCPGFENTNSDELVHCRLPHLYFKYYLRYSDWTFEPKHFPGHLVYTIFMWVKVVVERLLLSTIINSKSKIINIMLGPRRLSGTKGLKFNHEYVINNENSASN